MEQTVISLRVPEGQVEDWDEQVEELGHQSRTALIQTAVENYVAKGSSEGEAI